MDKHAVQYLVFTLVVGLALYADLRKLGQADELGMRQAVRRTLGYVGLALAFAVYLAATRGLEPSLLFLTGYVLEESLSVDNLFVIMAIFSSFCINGPRQRRVLAYGILGAIVMRLVFVAVGTALLEGFGKITLTAFGVFVLWSAYKMWSVTEAEEREDYTDHWAVRLAARFFRVHPRLEGQRFFVGKGKDLHCTPLFLCLVAVEVADLMFAFDSVPAVISVTRDPFLVYASNIFAILGLRSLYFALAAAKRDLRHLEKAVIAILVFIGFKMLTEVFLSVKIGPGLSLAVVAGLLAVGVAASLAGAPPKDAPKACPDRPADRERRG